MSMKEIIILLLGAILGNIPFILRHAKDLWSNWQLRRWREMVPALDTYSWIINYYQMHDAANSLYDCKIGNFEKKIPFFSRPEWQIPQKIDDNFHMLDLAYSDNQNYPVNTSLINSRTRRGHTLFNETTLYLDRIEQSGMNVKLHVKKCKYYQMASNLIALEDETYLCVRHKKLVSPSFGIGIFLIFPKWKSLC